MEYYESKKLLALSYLLECLNSKDGEMAKLAHDLKDLSDWEPPICQDCKFFKSLPDDHKRGTCDRIQRIVSVYPSEDLDIEIDKAQVVLPRLFGCYGFEEIE